MSRWLIDSLHVIEESEVLTKVKRKVRLSRSGERRQLEE
jgi:hypothetical protein